MGAAAGTSNEIEERLSRQSSEIYAREGVAHAWLVEPLQQTLEVLRLESGRWSLLATRSPRERVRAEPFEAIELDLATLWAG